MSNKRINEVFYKSIFSAQKMPRYCIFSIQQFFIYKILAFQNLVKMSATSAISLTSTVIIPIRALCEICSYSIEHLVNTKVAYEADKETVIPKGHILLIFDILAQQNLRTFQLNKIGAGQNWHRS